MNQENNILANLKVYEYAKEIGMETLALMNKIREWQLPVKSHMADLSPDLVAEIQKRLLAKDGPELIKKPAVRKKVAKKSPEAPPAPKRPIKKAASLSPAEPEKPVAKAAPARSVIRRRAGEGGAEEEVATANAPATHATAPIAAAPPPQTQTSGRTSSGSASSEPPKSRERMLAEAEALFSPKRVAAASEGNAEPIAATTPIEVSAQAPAAAPAAPAPAAASESAEPVVADAEDEGDSKQTGLAVRRGKREVLMTPRGPTSGVRSDAPRTNIVGRMDLTRVTPPPGQNFQPRGPRPQGPGPRNIRTGFVAQPVAPPVLDPEEEAENRRRFEEKNARRRAAGPGAGAGAGAGRELPEVASFSASEFRKREMVFQPKKKKGSLNREAMKTEITTPKASKRVVRMDKSITVGDLAQAMGVKAPQLIKPLMANGIMATITTSLDFETASLLAGEFQHEIINTHRSAEELLNEMAASTEEGALVERSPVVTVMGHVDHGKTTLLDSIRNAHVAAREAGGITQHIGAYQVHMPDGKQITFIDTPGHEAFTAMRARGANITDIAIIVVAADDGVMPQTAEAINHAKAAGVPIIVAVNKIDRPNIQIDRIKQQLTEFELVPEEWGGTTIFCPVSALNKIGIDELLEQIKLVAEVQELKANPERSGAGVVIESRLEKGRGPVATVLVKDGTLKIGQSIVAGAVWGRIRSMMNDRGEQIKEAGPSVPVEILGLNSTPQAGDRFDVVADERAAESVASLRHTELVRTEATPNSKMSLESIFSKLQQGDLKELPVILKGDVAGSVEAIKGMFEKLATAEVKIKLVHSGVGGINESDVLLASTAKGLVIGFNVRPDSGATSLAKRQNIEIKTYSIVYELMDQMKLAMQGLLRPDVVEKNLGRAEVRNIFTVPKVGTIAGSAVVDGKITRSGRARLVRDGRVIYEGNISSLKRFKDDVKEVASGYECGIGIENYNDIKVGDIIEVFQTETVARELYA